MDLDAVLEKRGHVLIQEFKPKGAPLPLGQRLTLQTFVKMGAEVWIVWEDPDKLHVEAGALDARGNIGFVEKLTVAKLRRRVATWYAAASGEE